MNKRIIAITVISLTFFFYSISSALAVFEATPIKRFLNDQRGQYSTDLFTGSVGYSYPIKVPKGANDLTPEISLSYNSSAAHLFLSYVGAGWEISRDYVERDINFTADNGRTSDDKFKLHFKGSVYDLVYVSADGRYHTKQESFLNIKKLSGGDNSQGDYWQVITQDGTKYRFGYQNQSELLCNERNYITSWNLDQVEDTHANKIYYTYEENAGSTYLNKIEYNTALQHKIEFAYTSISPYKVGYIQGCKISEVSRLANISVKTNSNLVRQYDFSFTLGENNQNRLSSITEKGSDGTELPPTTFTYKPQIKSWTQTNSWSINNGMDANLQMTNADVRVIDVNADGLPDVLKVTGDGQNTYKVYKNTGTTWNNTAETWLDNNPMDARPKQFWTRIIDMNGDGLPDIVKATQDTWYVWKNNGNGWNASASIWAGSSSLPGFTETNNQVGLADVNGDGLPDVVRTIVVSGPNTTVKVWKNTGTNFITTPETWIDNKDFDIRFYQTHMRMADVNADGLLDFVRIDNYGGPNNEWKVFLNTGSSWNITPTSWAYPIDVNVQSPEVLVTDTTGDGLPEIIRVVNNGGGNNDWWVWLNKGNKFNTSYDSWANPIDTSLINNETTMADVNGDGLIDILRSANTGPVNNDWRFFKNNGYAPDLLSTVKTSQGGTIAFEYTASTKYQNTGGDSLPDLSAPMWVVSKMTESNGMSNAHGTSNVTTYSYKNGLYKWQDREFRGFGEVNTVEPNGSKKKYVFNQDDALKGLLAEVQTRDSQDNPFAETENTWSSSQSNGVYTVKLASEKNYSYDGSASNPKITQIDYEYDSFGNVTKKTELGDTGVTGDERFTYFEYAINSSLWIINALKHTFLRAADGTTNMSESWLYYDGNSGLDDAPVKGDLIKEVKWLQGGTNPTTLHEYDSFGNETKATDANNRITQFVYDATGTYPVSTTNAKNQTSTMSYDLGTGNLLSKTDPNNFTTSYEYDAFGRIKKEIKPYDSTGFPTTFYQYFNDGIAPEGTLVSKGEVSGQAGTLDVYAWADGMGRKLQTRTDAEDITKQVVVNTFYDSNGEIAKETVSHLDNVNVVYVTPLTGIKTTEFSYDPLERVVSVKNTKGDTKTTVYDHWKQTHTDEKGNIKREYLNAYEKITKVEEVNGESTYATNYEYNSRDELTKITDALNNINTLTYDSLGRRTSQVDPDMGTWLYEYDGVDNLTKKTDNRGIATTITYDELNRKTKVDYPTDADTTSTYDANNKVGTLTSITDVAGTLNFSYDNRLRKIQETRIIDGNTFTTQYAYDALDRITSRTNPDGQTVNFAHNPQGEINAVTGIINNIDYNAQGKITKKDFANSITTNYTYNADDFRLNRIQTGSVFDTGYTYDKAGNVLSITDNLLTKTQNFSYDPLDRLASAQEVGGYTHAYEYNAIGNLTKLTDSSNVIDYTYGQNAGVHALTSSTEIAPTATPTPTPSEDIELLNNTWTLAGNNGSAGNNLAIPQDSLVGKESAVITFDLHGASFGGGDDEASIVFVQNGDWRAANITFFGAQNGVNGLQTVTIPLASFHKVGNSSITLDPNQPVSDVIARFWGDFAFTVDITSIKVVGQGSNNPTPTPTSTPTPTPSEGGQQAYKLVNQCSDKVMSVDNASTSNGANVLQKTWNGEGNQKWTIVNTSAGYYKFTAQHSGKVLDVSGVSTSSGANVHQWEWLGASNQEWSIIYVGDGLYKLLAKHSGKALDVDGASTQDGANIQQWVDNGTCAQKWQIIEI